MTFIDCLCQPWRGEDGRRRLEVGRSRMGCVSPGPLPAAAWLPVLGIDSEFRSLLPPFVLSCLGVAKAQRS